MAHLPYLLNYPPYAQVLPRITGTLSILGSVSIAHDVICRKKLAKVHHRVLLGMSLADIVSSICTVLGRIPAVHDDPVFPGYGTVGLCATQGFFYQTILSVIAYNFSLALYYVLLVCYNWRESRLKQAEIVMHLFALAVFLVSAITLASLQMFNPDYFLCFINSSPPGCESDCERGANPTTLRWAFFYGPAWLMIGLITALMALLYWTVRNQERRMDRFVFGRRSREPMSESTDNTSAVVAQQQPVIHQNTEKSRRVAVQGLWYTLPFYLTWVFPLTAHALGPTWIGQRGQPLLILVAIFLPLQGLMNAIVYARPMVVEKMTKARQSQQHTRQLTASRPPTTSHSTTTDNRPKIAERRDSWHV